jgi:hypothetical protein
MGVLQSLSWSAWFGAVVQGAADQAAAWHAAGEDASAQASLARIVMPGVKPNPPGGWLLARQEASTRTGLAGTRAAGALPATSLQSCIAATLGSGAVTRATSHTGSSTGRKVTPGSE